MHVLRKQDCLHSIRYLSSYFFKGLRQKTFSRQSQPRSWFKIFSFFFNPVGSICVSSDCVSSDCASSDCVSSDCVSSDCVSSDCADDGVDHALHVYAQLLTGVVRKRSGETKALKIILLC